MGAGAVQEHPGGRLSPGRAGIGLSDPAAGQGRGAASDRLQGPARPVDDGDRHHPGDAPPAPPAVEPAKIVRAHDPDEADAGTAPLEMASVSAV